MSAGAGGGHGAGVGGPGWDEDAPGDGDGLDLSILAAGQAEQGGLTLQQKMLKLLHSLGEAAASSQSQENPWRSS